jgi:hypothetical protein
MKPSSLCHTRLRRQLVAVAPRVVVVAESVDAASRGVARADAANR